MSIQNPKLDSFLEWLRKSNLSAPFVTLWIRTQPKLLTASKIKFPKGVEKLSKRAAQLGCSYENCVQNKTGDYEFRADSLWSGKGKHSFGSRYLVEHIDKPESKYLAYRPLGSQKDIDEWKDVATKEIISAPIEFLPKKAPSKTGVDWRVVAISNIEQIVCGEIFDLR